MRLRGKSQLLRWFVLVTKIWRSNKWKRNWRCCWCSRIEIDAFDAKHRRCRARRRLFNLSLSFDNCDLFLFGFVIWLVLIRNSMNRGVTVLDRRRALRVHLSWCALSFWNNFARWISEILFTSKRFPLEDEQSDCFWCDASNLYITIRQNICRQNKMSAKSSTISILIGWSTGKTKTSKYAKKLPLFWPIHPLKPIFSFRRNVFSKL